MPSTNARVYLIVGAVTSFQKDDRYVTTTHSTSSGPTPTPNSGNSNPSTTSSTSTSTNQFSHSELVIVVNLDHEKSSPTLSDQKLATLKMQVSQQVPNLDGLHLNARALRVAQDRTFEVLSLTVIETKQELTTLRSYVRESEPEKPNTVGPLLTAVVALVVALLLVSKKLWDSTDLNWWWVAAGAAFLISIGSFFWLMSNLSSYKALRKSWSSFELA